MRVKDLLVPDSVVKYRTPLLITRSFINQTTALSNWTIPLPSPPVAGRLMLLFVSVIQGRTISMPSWTTMTLPGVSGAAKAHYMAWKVAVDGEPSINISFLGNLSQGVACYYEVDNVDTTTTFYEIISSANQDGAGSYTTATSGTFSITRPTLALCSTVWIGGNAAWTPNNSFITQGSSLGATAHRLYTQPIINQNVTWTKGVGGTTSSTKVSVVKILGMVATTPSYDFAGYGPTFEPGYQNIINAANADGAKLPSPFWQARQNKLYKRWAAVGWLSANDWIYNFYHDGGENFNFYNWCNPSLFKIVKTGPSIVFNSLEGVRNQGNVSYYSTQYSAQSSNINYGVSGYSLFCDLSGSNAENGFAIGRASSGGYRTQPTRCVGLGGALTQVQREEARAAWLEYITL